ncbi:gas vesicle protein [Streptomyces bungoensis]|uniref:Gas vesicle protein n=1 Tax=Streptomyces bungoensis TaxID=285568 RepID=A0A124I5B8_9ACTN|nr:GvpL/GvpF family gas vesicle protein [Streptomyces bungoensis]KUN89459.1 gas vesicle protein [Streptomyces bungoensis]
MSGTRRDTVTYAFAVTRACPPADALAAEAGHDGGGPLRALPAGRLWLVVQDVPAQAFGGDRLTARLNSPDELESCARAHHRGVEAAARQGAVVPFPMATMYLDDRNAVQAVTDREPSLCALLDRLRDRTEWAVKVHAAEASAASGGAGDAAGAGATGGRDYLSRVSARRRTVREEHEKALAAAQAVDHELRRYAVAATRHRRQSEQLTGTRAPQLLNAAYLVEDGRRADFARALARLAADRRHPAVEISASGPWIPYSFARPEREWHGSCQEARA